jgi:hypothetical protein
MPVFELLCDGKVTIFKCGEEKLCLGAQKDNQTHVLWLNRDGTLYPGTQTTRTSVQADATHAAKQCAKCGPWPVPDAQGRPSRCASGARIRPSLPNAPYMWWRACGSHSIHKKTRLVLYVKMQQHSCAMITAYKEMGVGRV